MYNPCWSIRNTWFLKNSEKDSQTFIELHRPLMSQIPFLQLKGFNGEMIGTKSHTLQTSHLVSYTETTAYPRHVPEHPYFFLKGYNLVSVAAPPNEMTTSYMWLLKYKLNTIKIYFLSHIRHISNAQ